jgi:hypothetical protein
MSTFSGRYSGRPLVPLLECYVLWAIDELDENQAEILEAMAPGLRSVYRASGDWQDVIAAAMRWPNDMPRRVQEAWARNLKLGRGGSAPSAQRFAEAFVDDNFVPRSGPRPGLPAGLERELD